MGFFFMFELCMECMMGDGCHFGLLTVLCGMVWCRPTDALSFS